MEYLSIVTLGINQTHTLSALSELISKFECNLVHSNASIFASDLATMSLVCGNSNSITKLETALQELGESHDMTILIKRTQPNKNSKNVLVYKANIIGLNDSILVHEAISFFTEQQIIINDLSLKTANHDSAEISVFDLVMTLHIPIEINIHDLRSSFLTACEELNVDGKLEPAINIM